MRMCCIASGEMWSGQGGLWKRLHIRTCSNLCRSSRSGRTKALPTKCVSSTSSRRKLLSRHQVSQVSSPAPAPSAARFAWVSLSVCWLQRAVPCHPQGCSAGAMWSRPSPEGIFKPPRLSVVGASGGWGLETGLQRPQGNGLGLSAGERARRVSRMFPSHRTSEALGPEVQKGASEVVRFREFDEPPPPPKREVPPQTKKDHEPAPPFTAPSPQ